jgi:hypothetical protein
MTTVLIVENYPLGTLPPADLDWIGEPSTVFRGERPVWGVHDGAWRIIPLSWLGTIMAEARGLAAYLSKADFDALHDPARQDAIAAWRGECQRQVVEWREGNAK